MRIENIGQTEETTDNNKFNISIKNNKFYFQVGKDKHVLGSKIYPIGKRISMFHKNDEELQNKYEHVAKSFESSNWVHRNGYCYTNAEILHKAFKAHGVDAKYYAGWVFIGPSYPIHHAWVVVDDRVFDISIHEASQTLLQKQVDEGKDPYSKECAREVKALEAKIYPLNEHFTWGNPPDYMIYVGSEETPTTARIKYNNAMDKTKNHPSYRSMSKVGDEVNFKTKYQQLMDDI